MRITHFTTTHDNAQHALRITHPVRTMPVMKTGEKIKMIRVSKGLTLADVEHRAGLSDGNLSRVERGLQWLSEEKLRALAEALNVEPAEFFTQDNSSASPNKAVGRRVEVVDDDEEHPDVVRIRRVKLRLSAGIIGFATEQDQDDDHPLVFRRRWLAARQVQRENLIAIEVKGQSMEPGLYDGDTVIINTADTKPADGQVFAVNYEGEAVVKRLVRDSGFWWLVSDNPDQRRFPRKQCSGDMCLLIGRVIHKQSDYI
jgi:phage repressor protein C with HTH and peptisase S24 domain